MASVLFKNALVIVRGGGDLASGVIYRLHRTGFPVAVIELPVPRLVRRTVSFGEAALSDVVTVEGITARRVDVEQVWTTIDQGEIPVLCDPDGRLISTLAPLVLVDARMEKKPLDTRPDAAPLVIALGPGYIAGEHCHAVIETNRGHYLGRVIWQGSAEPDTGVPGHIGGQNRHSRVLRAPADGLVEPYAAIGDIIHTGQLIAKVASHPIVAPFDGMLRGLVNPRLPVTSGMKIGDLDPRIQRENCFTISEKSLAIGGGVLEAVLSAPQVRAVLRTAEP